MITLYDKLIEISSYEELTDILISLDHMLEILHNNGLCIYDFNPKKIILYDNKFTYQSFNGLLNDIGVAENMKYINILQLAKIGLNAYKGSITDGVINQEKYDMIRNEDNWKKFYSNNGHIPEDIYEYYEEIFLNGNITYMNDYLLKKEQERNGNQNSNVMRKSLSTAVGRSYVDNEEKSAFVGIMFIPSILALTYLIGLIIYIFVIK